MSERSTSELRPAPAVCDKQERVRRHFIVLALNVNCLLINMIH